MVPLTAIAPALFGLAGLAVGIVLIALFAVYVHRTLTARLGAQQAELERAVEELAEGKERIERFEEFGRRVASYSDLEPLASDVLQQLTELVDAPVGTLYAIRAPQDEVAHLLAYRGTARNALPPSVGVDDGLPGRAISEGRTVSVSHDETALVSASHQIDVPLFLGDRVVGVVTLARREDRGFTTTEILAVEYLSRQVAVGIANAVSLRDARRQAAINHAVLETATDAFVSMDAEGRISAWNRSAEAMFGWPRAEAIGRSLSETIVPPALREAYERGLASFVESGASGMMNRSLELTALHRDGRAIPVELTISPLMLDGEWTFNAFVRDVSDRAEAERLKDEFFALVSHELRTPLTSIIGYLELVLEEPERLDPHTSRFLEVVERNGRRLQRLVGDILFVAQVEAGKLSIHKDVLDLTSVVADCVEAARPRAEERGIALRLDAVKVPAGAGDADRIGQALDNLVSNAVKFTPEGGSVEVSLRRDGGDAVIEVRDTGIGIPAGEQDRLFERFFRSSAATERAIPGVGLGLTIVKAIVEAHGGQIAVASEQGQGTTCTVRLPVGATPATEIAMDAPRVAIQRISR